MSNLISFMQAYTGRALRVILGLALIYLGLAVVGGTVGIVVAIVGLVPIAMGAWGPCLVGFIYKPTRA